MDEFLQRVYLEEVIQECLYCLEAVERMNHALADTEGRLDLFQPALDLVHHAAAASRLLWPSGGKNKQARARAMRRGQFLRDLLGVRPDHPIQDRTLRDHFEHFDERLDEWAETSRNRNIVKRLIGPRIAISGDAIQDGDIIRHYDPATKHLAFRGEAFDIQRLVEGIQDIHVRAQRRLRELEVPRRDAEPNA